MMLSVSLCWCVASDCCLCPVLQVPTFIPVVMLFFSAYLVVAPIVYNPRIEFFYAALFVLSGMVFYVPFIAYRVQLTFLSKSIILLNVFGFGQELRPRSVLGHKLL